MVGHLPPGYFQWGVSPNPRATCEGVGQVVKGPPSLWPPFGRADMIMAYFMQVSGLILCLRLDSQNEHAVYKILSPAIDLPDGLATTPSSTPRSMFVDGEILDRLLGLRRRDSAVTISTRGFAAIGRPDASRAYRQPFTGARAADKLRFVAQRVTGASRLPWLARATSCGAAPMIVEGRRASADHRLLTGRAGFGVSAYRA